jgi:hypothetical protein
VGSAPGFEHARAIGRTEVPDQPPRGFPLDHQVASAGFRIGDANLGSWVPADKHGLTGADHNGRVALPRLHDLELRRRTETCQFLPLQLNRVTVEACDGE